MSSELKDLSSYNADQVPDASRMCFGIVVSEWNREITDNLLDGTISTLLKHGVPKSKILTIHVPGSFELPLGAQFLAGSEKVDAVICLGCVIQGETRHFDYICQGLTQGVMDLNLKFNLPFIFGVLTTSNLEQAKERAGGIHGNKGIEAAITAIKMVHLYRTSCNGEKRNHTP